MFLKISARPLLTHLLVIAGWTTLCLASVGGMLQAALSLIYLLLVPGYLTSSLIIGKERARLPLQRQLGYYVGQSLLLLMLSGLLLNEAYDLLGYSHPLTLVPLTIMISAISTGLTLLAARRGTLIRRLPKFKKIWKNHIRFLPAILLCICMPVIAAAGAITLNNGGADGLAMLSFAMVGFLFLAFLFRDRDLGRYYPLYLFSAALSLLIGTSLRGWNITGHDVMQEYQVFELTLRHAAWHMNYYQDAYTACLSITILPTILQRLTMISDPFIYKLVFQMFFALMAPILYESFKRFTSRKLALLACFLFITFPTFLMDIMMLNRQETAFLFLALSLMAATDKLLNKKARSLLILSFLSGMVVSHYSTSYEAIGTFIIAIMIGLVWKLFQRRRPDQDQLVDSPSSRLYTTPIVAAVLVLLIGWGSIATQTSSNISQTISSLSSSLSHEFSHSKSTTVSPSLTQFSEASRQSVNLPNSAYYPAKVVNKYPLKPAQETTAPLTNLSKTVGLKQHLLSSFYGIIKSGYELLIAMSIPGGIFYVLKKRRKFNVPIQYLMLGAGSFIMLGVEQAFPAAINYGLARAIQQSLIFTALPIILLLLYLLKLLRFSSVIAQRFLAVVLVCFFFILSGFLPSLTGGSDPMLALSNSGLYYSAYYTHQEEISAANWLVNDTPKGSQVYSDEFARRKLIAYASIFSQPTLAPDAIPKDSYVYLSYGNNEFDQVPVYDGSALLYYKPPTSFLSNEKNQVYSSSNVTIYK
jgi:uncharacterized membrane protein